MTYVAPIDPPVAITAPLPIEQRIVLRAQEIGYNPAKAVAIAKAESRFMPNAKNPKSTASGVFQFLDGTFKYFCIEKYELAESMAQKNDPDIQIECALRILKDGGEKHWDASKSVWLSYL